jgi:Trypsin-like peptidase domain
MLRPRLIKIKLAISILIPILVFVTAYRLARVFFPATVDADAAYDESFSEEEWTEQITDAFKLYAQAFANRFPEVERIYGDELMGAVRKNLKLPPNAGLSPKNGFGRLTQLQRLDPTFGYHGSGAKLGDPNRVLVHWSTAEGRSQVIFCDLSHREVDGGELVRLLSPWQTVAKQCVVRVGSGGSGTVVSPKGLIVTAAHVLPSNASRVEIHFADGRALTSTVVGQSKRFDVAVLKIPVEQSIPFIRLEEQPVREDQAAWVIGYGGGRSEPNIREVRTVQYVLDELITTSNKIIGGDCGGAVLNAKGCLVGVLSGPADPYQRACRTTSSPTLLKVFPLLIKAE